MSSSIVVNTGETDRTEFHDQVIVENGKVFQEKYHYKQFNTIKEIQWVIHDLVINKGFIMDQQYNGQVRLHNPGMTCSYIIWPKTCEIEKVDKIMVGSLE